MLTKSTQPPTTVTTQQPYPWKQIIGLGTARCFFRASTMIVMSCNFEMLIAYAFNGDSLKAQLLLTKIDTVDTLASFWIGPIKASFLDSFGRKAGMVYPTLIIAATRVYYSYAPSGKRYMLYRAAVSMCAAFFSGYTASLTDLIDPTTDAFTATNQALDQAATITGIVTLLVVSRLKNPRTGMFLASLLYLGAAGTVHFTVEETLSNQERKPMPWRRLLSNPFAPLSYFWKTKEIFRYTVLSAFWEISQIAQNSTLGTFRRQVHGWGMAENAKQQFRQQVCDIVGSFGGIPTMRWLGLRGTHFVGRSLSIAQTVVNMVAPSQWTFLTVVLVGVRYDGLAMARESSFWRKRAGATVSEEGAANMNLFRILNLFLPSMWVKLYAATAKTRPRTVFGISLALQIIALCMTPVLWPGSQDIKKIHTSN